MAGNKPGLYSRSSASETDIAHQWLENIQLDDPTELHPTLPARPGCFRSIVHEMFFVFACSFAGATFAFLQRSSVVILDSLQQGLRMTPSELSWSLAGPGLTTGALLLPMAFLLEHLRPTISRKHILVGSLLAFSILVGICAASVDGIFLDVVCALAGIPCALHLPTVISILDSAFPFPSRRKTVAYAVFLASSNPTAAIVGSVLSGAISSRFTWRGAFVFLAVLFTLVAGLSLLAVPNLDRQPELGKALAKEDEEAASEVSPRKTSMGARDFDWRGTVLLVLAIGLFSVALTAAPEARDGWSAPYVWLLFTISLVCLGLFVYWERVAQYPLIPRMVWDEPGLLVTLIFTFLMSMSGCSLVFWMPLFMEAVQFKTALETAVRLLPIAVTGICISPLLSLVLHRVNNGLVAAVSAFCMIGSNIALFYLRAGSKYWTTAFPAMVLSTIAMDWSVSVGIAAVSSSLPLHHHPAGLGLVFTVTRLAIPAGLAVTTAVHTSFAGRSDMTYPEVPYTNVFYTTLSLSVLALTLVPFLQLRNPSPKHKRNHLSLFVNVDPSEDLRYRDFADAPTFSIQPRVSSLHANKQQLAAAAAAAAAEQAPNTTRAEAGPSNLQRAGSHRSSTAGDRVIWLVCEDCGASKRMVEQVGDPVRYFYAGDEGGGSSAAAGQRSGSSSLSGRSVGTTVRIPPLCKDLNSLRG